MKDDEPALLHEADLMLAILRAARQAQPASTTRWPDCMHISPRRMSRYLSQRATCAAGSNVRRCFSGAATRSHLPATTGSVLPRVAPGCSPNTRTRRQSVLCAFPEFRTFLTALSPKRFEDDPRLPAFQAGMQAFAERRSLADNPHAFDSVDHLAWECGWSEAREANRPR